MTGFSLVPLQFFSLLGIALSFGSAALFILLIIRRFVMGAEVQGVFTLFAISFFLMGVILFGIGLLGEYVGRIYLQVRARPRYVIQALLQADDAESPASAQHTVKLRAMSTELADGGFNDSAAGAGRS